MFHLGLVEVIVADREREIETNIRRQRRLRPEDAAVEPTAPIRRPDNGRPLVIRARPTGG